MVAQNKGERSFHIFYQLLQSQDPKLLGHLELSTDPMEYHYLRQGDTPRVSTISDHKDFVTVKKALSVLGFSEEEDGVRIG